MPLKNGNCRVGMVLRLKQSPVINLWMGVGDGTHTFVELLALWDLSWFAK